MKKTFGIRATVMGATVVLLVSAAGAGTASANESHAQGGGTTASVDSQPPVSPTDEYLEAWKKRQIESAAPGGSVLSRSGAPSCPEGPTCTVVVPPDETDLGPAAMQRLAQERDKVLAKNRALRAAPAAPGTGVLAPPILPWSEQCNNFVSPHNFNGTYQGYPYYFHMARDGACAVQERKVETWTTTQPRQLLGTAEFLVLSWMDLNPSSRTYQVGVDIQKRNPTGVWVAGGEVSAEFVCYQMQGAGTCDAQGSTPSLFVSIGTGLAGTWDATSIGTGIDVTTAGIVFQARSSATDVTYARVGAPQPTEVRCDSHTYVRSTAPGCVNYGVDPWLTTYSTSDAAHGITATHIKNAQASLPDHWSQRTISGTNPDGRILLGPSGTPLTRLYNRPIQDANRTAACAGFVKNDAEDSCDEFPFASTNQGASLVPDPTRRSVAHVPLADNVSAGRFLNTNLYSLQRVLDGEAFWITVDGPVGIH